MRNWKNHTKISLTLAFIFSVIMLANCAEHEEKEEILIAEVGDSKLTQTELNKQLGQLKNNRRYKDEVIRDWVETEVLFQVSESKNLLTSDNYVNIIKDTKKELAASIAIKDYLEYNPVKYSERDLREFFNDNKEDFNFIHDSYVLNFASFSSESGAIKFRNNVINDGWNSAIAKFDSDSSLIEKYEKKLFRLSEIQSKRIQRILQKLKSNEVSLVIKTELNSFVVVQQIDLILKNTVPQYQYVKESVKNSFLANKSREQINYYIDSLINNMNVKIY